MPVISVNYMSVFLFGESWFEGRLCGPSLVICKVLDNGPGTEPHDRRNPPYLTKIAS